MENFGRREFLRRSAIAGAGVAAMALTGCDNADPVAYSIEAVSFRSRPSPFSGVAPRGFTSINVWSKSDAYLYVPSSYKDNRPAPFLLLLHGAGGSCWNFAANLPSRLGDLDVVVLAVDSVAATWDLMSTGGFGPDIERLDLALGYAFRTANIDPTRIGIGGFSDGATYALSAGLANGDLFKSLIAFSPGGVYAPAARGKPRVFVSHGTKDSVIPFSNSQAVIVPSLRADGYDVTFREFVGDHLVPADVATEAYTWLASPT